MPDGINQEEVNDRAKLIMHRVVARMLARDPELVDRARACHAGRAERMPGMGFLAEWDALLDMPPAILRRALTSRHETMARLRLSSPFMLVEGLGFDEPDERRRLWRLARKGIILARSRDEEPVDAPACP